MERWKVLSFLFFFWGACYFAEGYVEVEEFDLDLELGSFTLHFTASVELPLNLQYLRFLDHEEVASVSYSPVNATSFSVVNETTVVVTLSETDVQTMIDIPGLCLNENSCYIGYTHNLIRDSNNGPTLPGVKRVSKFNPYPLYFETFELDLNRGVLTLEFNKNVSVDSIDGSALTFLSVMTGSITNGHAVLGTGCYSFLGCSDGPLVVVSLSEDDQNAIKANKDLCTNVSNCYVVFNDNLVTDLGGYAVRVPKSSSPTRATWFTPDVTPPRLVAFGFNFNDKTIYLQFSESVDRDTFNISNGDLVIYNPSVHNFTVDVNMATETGNIGVNVFNYSTVLVLEAVSVVDAIIHKIPRESIVDTYIDMYDSIIQDYSGNRAHPDEDVPLFWSIGEEALAISVDYNFVYDMHTESLRITFPCQAPDLYPGDNVAVFNGEPALASHMYTMASEYCSGYSSDVVCYLTHNLTKEFVLQANITDSEADLWALTESFCEEGGTLSVRVDEIDEETTPVKLLAFTMDMNEGRIQLTFDSLISSTVDVTQVSLQSEGDSNIQSVTLSPDSQYELSDWLLNIYLTDDDLKSMEQLQVAGSITSSYVCIGTGVVSDLYGNNAEEVPCNGALQAERYIRATPPVPTVLEGFLFNCETGRLQLNFSQLVYTKTLRLNQAILLNERGDTYKLWKGDYAVEYTASVDILLSSYDLDMIHGMNGFLVNSNFIYLNHTEMLVYDVNDKLLNVTERVLSAGPMTRACRCHAGYRLNTDQTTCIDIDECSEAGTDPNIQSCGHTCTNTNGSYFCTCDDGYRLQEDQHTCNDTNECEEGLYNCTQFCVNDPGSYHCECDITEYVLLSDGITCENKNHCSAIDHNCSHYCVDDYGTYRCGCDEGYRLGSDEHTCEDIDECTEGTSRCNQNCSNTEGNYTCDCFSGYQLSSDTYTCLDIDECLDDNGGCQQICTNLIGSHECSCELGYTLQQDKIRCVADPCNTTLMDPEYGSVSCDGAPVTDTSCTFTCQPGFYVVGSRVRTCQGDHTWSGVNVMCDRLRCEELTAFHDAAVKQPCDNSYESSCTIECLPAYFNPYPNMTTMECVLTSEANNTVEWTQRPYCQEREPCLPTPCKHNAHCTEIEVETGRLPVCDCSGTGYIGDYCDIGVISVPNLPILLVGITRQITISAFPDDDLRVDLITDLDVSPKH